MTRESVSGFLRFWPKAITLSRDSVSFGRIKKKWSFHGNREAVIGADAVDSVF